MRLLTRICLCFVLVAGVALAQRGGGARGGGGFHGGGVGGGMRGRGYRGGGYVGGSYNGYRYGGHQGYYRSYRGYYRGYYAPYWGWGWPYWVFISVGDTGRATNLTMLIRIPTRAMPTTSPHQCDGDLSSRTKALSMPLPPGPS